MYESVGTNDHDIHIDDDEPIFESSNFQKAQGRNRRRDCVAFLLMIGFIFLILQCQVDSGPNSGLIHSFSSTYPSLSPSIGSSSIPSPFPNSDLLPVSWTRNDFELVMVRFEETLEDLSWSEPFSRVRTILNQGDLFSVNPKGNVIQVEDKGWDAYAKLTHITSRYDSLANVTFFVQTNINDRSDQMIVDRPSNGESAWSDFFNNDPDFLSYHPTTVHRRVDGGFRMKNCAFTLQDVYNSLGIRYEVSDEWAPGYWVAVGKNKIRSRSLESWEKMRKWTFEDHNCSMRSASCYIERIFVPALKKSDVQL